MEPLAIGCLNAVDVHTVPVMLNIVTDVRVNRNANEAKVLPTPIAILVGA
jgi:hypothetical protein